MATTINHPYQTNILSAAGSAEVLGRGSNTYTDTWSHSSVLTHLEDWDKFINFPTAVRTGNFVWVLQQIYGSNNEAIWILADVVPDPSVDRQFGNNIAYPEIPDHVKYQFDFTANAAAYKAGVDSINTDTTAGGYDISIDGTPRYAFTLTDHQTAAANGNTQSYFDSTSRQYKEIVYNGSNGGGFITTDTAHVPRLFGWGSKQRLLQTNNSAFNVPNDGNDFIYNLWAPFATKAQFDTLYGTEDAWIHSTVSGSHHVLFDQVYIKTGTNGNRTVVYNEDTVISPSGPRVYPFALPTFTSNTLFKEVPGDTTGDGIDNTPSFEDALALTAVASIIECDGFPPNIIPGLDMSTINEKLDKVKAGIESAISSTGLLDLEEKLEGFKDSLIDKFPDPTKVRNFIEAIADLDLNNIAKEGIELIKNNLKEEWRDAIDEVDEFVDDIIDNIADFDICSLIGLEGKTGADGKLVKKPETPSIPDKAIEGPKQSSYAPTKSKGTAQTTAAASAGITPKDLENANNALEDNWKDLSEDAQFSWGRKIEVGPQEGPRRTIILDEIEWEAVLDENGELVEKLDADGYPIRAGRGGGEGQGGELEFSSQSEASFIDSLGSEVKIHGHGIGTVYDRNKRPKLYENGAGGGRYTGVEVNPYDLDPDRDAQKAGTGPLYKGFLGFPNLGRTGADLVLPPDVPGKTSPLTPPGVAGITDTDLPGKQQRIDDYLNLEGGGSPEAANKLAEQPVSKTGPEWEKRLQEIKASKDYQTYVTAINNKVDPRAKYSLPGDSELGSRGGMSQESLDKLSADIQQVTIGLHIYREWKARFNYYKEKLKNSMLVDGKRGEYFPSTDYDITNKWKKYDETYPDNLMAPGTSFYLNDVVPMSQTGFASDFGSTTMTEKAANTVAGMDDEFITAIKKYFFNEEAVRLQQEIMMGQDPPFDEIIQKKLRDALVPNDNEGDPVTDNVAPIKGYDPKSKKDIPGRVINISATEGAARSGPVRTDLLNILKRSAEEANYTIEIFSGGQVPAAKGGRHGVNRYGNTTRHDDGFAVDIYTYNENGRQLRVQPSSNNKDTLAIKDFLIILLKNGITSVGADHDYMNGDLHLDIAIPSKAAPIAHWGKGPDGLKSKYAPAWLTTIFNGDYNKQYQAMLLRKELEKKNNKG